MNGAGPPAFVIFLCLRWLPLTFVFRRGFLRRLAGHSVLATSSQLDVAAGDPLAFVSLSGCSLSTVDYDDFASSGAFCDIFSFEIG